MCRDPRRAIVPQSHRASSSRPIGSEDNTPRCLGNGCQIVEGLAADLREETLQCPLYDAAEEAEIDIHEFAYLDTLLDDCDARRMQARVQAARIANMGSVLTATALVPPRLWAASYGDSRETVTSSMGIGKGVLQESHCARAGLRRRAF